MSIITEKRLRREIERQKLVVTPLLDPGQIEGGSVNVRLGTRLIMTKRQEYPFIDPEKLSRERIGKFQTKVSLVLGYHFILHPGELVLAATLEFIHLPPYFSGYVVSRSSYGRIGLIVATATYIHPDWRGCLTLELVNAGNVPIKLRCGAPIAQLIVQHATPKYIEPNQTSIPTGPAFSILDRDPTWRRLANLRSLWKTEESE